MDMQPEGMVQVTKEQAEPAIDVLAAAFRDYPAIKYYFPDELSWERIAPNFVAYAVYTGIAYGRVYTTSPSLEGIAVWLPPGSYPVDMWKSLKSVPFSVLFGFGRNGGSRMKQLGEHVDAVHRRLISYPHWYLNIIGVQPELKGKGFSSRLVRPMLQKMEAEGIPCYLETLDEYNVPIYERFGFVVIDESIVPDSDLKSWAMLKK